MKRCGHCGKTYDDSWKVCLECRVELSGGVDEEIRDIRSAISSLSRRVDVLESSLKGEKPGDAPAFEKKGHSRPPEVFDAAAKPDFSIFRDNEPAPVQNKKEKVSIVSSFSLFKEEKGEKKTSMSWNIEQMLGEKWFNKLGVFAVVIGVALLIGYSFKYLGPAAKIGIGYAFGLGLVGYGVFIEKKKDLSVFGKSLVAGGWAINYFTTFAMHHIPEVRLVPSPVAGMALLIAVSAAAIAHIYRYRSEVATSFSYLLMFITLMITPVSLYTMSASILVAVSLIYFMYKMKWNSFAIYGMIMSYLSYVAFLARSPKVEIQFALFVIVTAYLGIYWLIFVIAGSLMKSGGEENEAISRKDFTFLLNSTGASLCGYILAVNGFGKYVLALIMTGIAAHLLLTAWAYLSKERGTYIISSSFAIAFALIYAGMKFTGYTMTVSYLVIAQGILLAGVILKELFWRQLASILLVCIFVKLILLDSYLSLYMMGESPVPGKIFGGLNSRTVLFAIGFAIFMANQFVYSYLYRKKTADTMEDKWGVMFSYFYTAIFAVGTWLDLPKVLTGPAWVILGVILLELGISKDNRHQRRQGYILTVGSFLRLLMSNFTVAGGISILSYRLITVAPVLMVLYYCHMLLSEERGIGVVREEEKNMHILYSYLVFIGIMLLARFEVPGDLVAPAWALISGGYVIWAVISKERYYLPICSIGALAAAFRAGTVNIIQPGYLVGVDFNLGIAISTAAVLYAGNVILLKNPEVAVDEEDIPGGRFKRFLRSGQFVHALCATGVMTLIIVARTSGVLMTAALASEGLVLFLAGFYVKEKNWRLFALGILLSTLAKAFLVDLRKLETIYYIMSLIILGVVLLFVSYMYNKYKDKIKKII